MPPVAAHPPKRLKPKRSQNEKTHPMPDLKLIALDPEDLSVIAAHLQDAVLLTGDIAFRKTERRLVFVANRFDWSEAVAKDTPRKEYTRRRTGVRIERVQSAKVSGIDQSAKDQVLSLLTMTFEVTTEPAGILTLRFAGGGAIRLDVECVEVGLDDLGAAWATRKKPEHKDG